MYIKKYIFESFIENDEEKNIEHNLVFDNQILNEGKFTNQEVLIQEIVQDEPKIDIEELLKQEYERGFRAAHSEINIINESESLNKQIVILLDEISNKISQVNNKIYEDEQKMINMVIYASIEMAKKVSRHLDLNTKSLIEEISANIKKLSIQTNKVNIYLSNKVFNNISEYITQDNTKFSNNVSFIPNDEVLDTDYKIEWESGFTESRAEDIWNKLEEHLIASIKKFF